MTAPSANQPADTLAKEDPSSSRASTARLGWLANVCAIGSLAMCFGKVVIAYVIGLFGLGVWGVAGTEGILPHIQAVLMWGLAALVLISVVGDRKRHGRSLPVHVAAAGLTIMVGTLYVYYDPYILFLAYVFIIFAAFLNQSFILRNLYDTVRSQAQDLDTWNRTLESRVAEQVGEIDRLGRLKRFLSPQVVELVTEIGDERLLASHRQYIAAVFCDLRGFTAFSSECEPEEAMAVLQAYHEEMGKLISAYNGTIDHRAGDGLMVIFNDPVPCDEPVLESVRMAVAMRTRMAEIAKDWRRKGYDIGFGVGIAAGYATLGMVGFEGRYDYTANGNAVNLASRLCDAAKDGEIVVDRHTLLEIEEKVETDRLPARNVKGFDKPIECFNLTGLRED